MTVKEITLPKIDESVQYALENGLWLNATDVAKRHNKRLDKYFRSPNTIEYIRELCRFNSIDITELKISKEGRYGGTYIHESLVIHFLLWIEIPYKSVISLDFITQNMIDTYLKIAGGITKRIKPKQSKGIYIITDSRAYKIGIATNIKQRVSSLQVGNPYKLKALYFNKVKRPRSIETLLHNRFQDKRLIGEWFNLDSKDIEIVIEFIKENELKGNQ